MQRIELQQSAGEAEERRRRERGIYRRDRVETMPSLCRSHDDSLRSVVWLARAQRTLPWQDNIPLVRALCTGMFPAAVDRRAKVVGSRVHTGRVDVVIFCKVAHCGCVY